MSIRGGLTCGWSTNGFGHFNHVDNNSLDAISLALNFGHDPRHFVAVEGIADAAVNIDAAHFGRGNLTQGMEGDSDGRV